MIEGAILLNKINPLSSEDKLGILLFFSSFIFVGIMLAICFKVSITQDGAFSLLLIQENYFNLVFLATLDVHPPLYYFILKFVVSLFQVFGLSVDSTIVVAKFVSVVPFVLLLVLSFFKVREYWGWLCCGVFAVCLTSMPQLMYFAVEIRMYSWALFFVTVCFIYAYGVIVESSRKNWVMLVLSGVCAAYTHYFAAVSVIIIFLLLLMYFVFNERSMVKKWFFAVIISSSLYFFWLFVLVNQITRVNKKFWIKPITFDTVCGYLWFIVSPSNIFQPSMELLGVLLVVLYIFVFVYYFVNCKSENQEYFILSGTFVLILTAFIGIIVSILFKPVFIARYVVPSLGVFWLTFAFLISRFWNYKKLFAIILVVILLISTMSTVTFINFEIEVHNDYVVLNSFLKQDIIKNDNFVMDTNGTCLLPEFKPIEYLLGQYHNNDFSYLNSSLGNNKTIWLFSSKDFNLVLKNCTKQNITLEEYGIYDGFAQDTYPNNQYTIYKIKPTT